MERIPNIEILQRMRQVRAPVTTAEAEHARRQRVSSRILELQAEYALKRERRRRFGRPLAASGILLVAAALVLWLRGGTVPQSDGDAHAAHLLSGQVDVRVQGTDIASVTKTALVSLDLEQELVVESDTAELRMPSSTKLTAQRGSRFRMARQHVAGHWQEYVYINSGVLDLDVPELGKRPPLAVRTDAASIEVRGTRLSVDVPSTAEGPTRVEVGEGEVVVRTAMGMTIVSAGQIWESTTSPSIKPSSGTSTAAAPAASSAMPSPSGEQLTPSRAPTPARPGAATTASSAGASSPLRDANRLMQTALLAKTNGMQELALQRFVELIHQFPASEPAATARVERFRILSRLGRRAEARRAARQYLKAHPHGFASGEAEALVGGNE